MNVLFIGNSHTYYNDLVVTIQELSPGCINAVEISHGGYTLYQHLQIPSTVAAITDGPDGPGGSVPWDWVVMQPNSSEQHLVWPDGNGTGTVNTTRFISAGRQMAKLAREATNGPAKVMLYGVWPKAYPYDVYKYDEFDVGATPVELAALCQASFDQLRNEIEIDGGTLAIPPIMTAWIGGAKGRCGICEPLLYQRFDWNHATPVGSYLTAVILWRALTGCSTRGLPAITNSQPSWPPGQRGLIVTPQLAWCAQQSADVLVPGGCHCLCKCRLRVTRQHREQKVATVVTTVAATVAVVPESESVLANE